MQLTRHEEEQTIIKIIETLLDSSVPFSGKHRRASWEKGWAENLKSKDLRPKYFGKYPVTRLDGKFVKGLDEQKMLYSIVDSLAKKYLSKASVVYEFGCGTGHNLLRVRKVNKKAVLFGLDWVESSVKLVQLLGFGSRIFDFFNPRGTLCRHAGVYTVAALEQTGTAYKQFVRFLIRNDPSIVVHIEPIPELLDPTNLLDYLSIKYMEKRKYLSGYLDHLRELEAKGEIEIIEARRSGIGSMFIDGYSIIVWKPL